MMESEKDIRWEQRLSNFNKALSKLEASVRYIQDNPMEAGNPGDADGNEDTLSDLVKQGLILSPLNYSFRVSKRLFCSP